MKPIEELLPEIGSDNKNKFVFLSLNRYHPAKKLEFAISAMAKLRTYVSKEEWENIFLVMAGI